MHWGVSLCLPDMNLSASSTTFRLFLSRLLLVSLLFLSFLSLPSPTVSTRHIRDSEPAGYQGPSNFGCPLGGSGCVAYAIQQRVSGLITQYHIVPDIDMAGTHIPLTLSSSTWQLYPALQEKIASIIPTEHMRPTVDLYITDAAHPDAVEHSIGISGGTGPLSDAELLTVVMKKLSSSRSISIDWYTFCIHLYSSPPPRSAYQAISHPTYITGLRHFAHQGHPKYYLASNTAHENIHMFSRLLSSKSEVVDLADYVAHHAARPVDVGGGAEAQAEVLVLGTIAAYNKNLYPKYLAKNGLAPAGDTAGLLPTPTTAAVGQYRVVHSKPDAIELQKYIDEAKSGDVVAAGKAIHGFIQRELQWIRANNAQAPNKILLGCTEIPMSLQQSGMLAALKQDMPQVEFINTETLFAEKMVQDIQEMNNSPMAQPKF